MLAYLPTSVQNCDPEKQHRQTLIKLATLDTGDLGHAAILSSNNDLLDLVTSGIATDAPSAVKDILGHDNAMYTVRKALDKLEALSDDEQ
ncbi:MAG: hypothetical protein OSB67_01475 [Alphaproteobacteria bacterium]|nr:hypothetical protein [Alphaproteobacteria bacterium]